jgi:predicted CoA-substrate-specific enzyme activase
MEEIYVGIDIGSVSINVAILNAKKEVLKDYYIRIEGAPLERTYKNLKEVFAAYPKGQIKGLAATGSGGKLLSKVLNIPFVNEILAQTKSTGYLYPEAKTIIEIGGEDSKFILLEYDEKLGMHVIKDFAMNTICAAGTGSFLDQQAARLGLSIEEFGELALRSKKPPRIAGRCSVFANTDMIHLQQEAVPEYDIVAGLCFALARNFKSVIAKGKKFVKPVAFQGGVAANEGMRRAFKETLELKDGEFIIPKHFASMGAIGAALALIDDQGLLTQYKDIEEINEYLRTHKEEHKGLKPLVESKGKVTKHPWTEKPELSRDKKLGVYLGIDIGSISTNVVAVDDKKRLVARRYLWTAGKPIDAARKGIEEIGKEIGDYIEVKGVGTTGSGRYMIGDLVGADVVKNEITAQARASIEIDPNVDTIFEIGGQDSKYISLENGAIVDFEMNKVCAAGTGSFLEEQAERLDLQIKEEFGACALQSESPVMLGERCTVFMQSDLTGHQQRGAKREDLVAGLAYSIAYNYLNRVVGTKRIGKNIFFQGAVAHNKGVVAAFENVLGRQITVPPHNDVTGAIGVAILAMEYMKKNHKDKSDFKGFDLSKKKYEIETFECKDCPNRCEVRKVIVEGEDPLFYGSRCEKYEVRKKKKKTGLPDLFKERERLLLKAYRKKPKVEGPKVGIPRSLIFQEYLPLWATFFQELGFQVVLSDNTNKKITHEGVEAVISEHCFPIKVTHGHVMNLMEKGVDYIFLPSLISMQQEDHRIEQSYACPFVQASPYIIKAALDIESKGIKVLTPTLYFKRGKKHLEDELSKMCNRLGIGKGEVKKALDKALQAQEDFYKAIKARGKEILSDLKGRAVILVGRPYNTCDAGLNLNIPKILSDREVLTIPMDFLELENVDIGKDWPSMYWRYGQRILSALRVIKQHPKLYPLYITNFGCGPDSFIQRYFGKEMGKKPYLIIEVDEHSAPAGVITRCEAFLDSLENVKEVVEPAVRVFREYRDDFNGRKMYIPFMGYQAYIVAAAFRACGIDADVTPIADQESVELGRKYATGKECFPCILTTGDMVKLIRQPGVDRNKIAFFMPEASGPCRFGQYNKLQRVILSDLGYDDVPIISPNQASDFYKTLSEYGQDFDKRAWRGLCAVDMMDKLARETRPYEINKDETDKVYFECLDQVCKAIEGDGNVRKVMKDIRKKFKNIKIDRSERKPIIGIVGEIYIRSHIFANDYIVKTIEEFGGEAWLPPMAEWFFYVNFRRKEDNIADKNYREYIMHYIKDWWMKRTEHSMHKGFEDMVLNFEEPRTEEVFEYGNPYLDRRVEGEAILSVGKAIDFIKKGVSGVVNVMPFTCMPGTNTSAVMLKVKEEYDNIPFLNMAYDGLGQATSRTRIEAFMHQARQFMLRKKRAQ